MIHGETDNSQGHQRTLLVLESDRETLPETDVPL